MADMVADLLRFDDTTTFDADTEFVGDNVIGNDTRSFWMSANSLFKEAKGRSADVRIVILASHFSS